MGKDTGKPDGRASSLIFPIVIFSTVFLCVCILVCMSFTPIFAVAMLLRQIGDAFADLLPVFFWIAGAIYLILNIEWSQLAWLLLMLLGWLLSDGLP